MAWLEKNKNGQEILSSYKPYTTKLKDEPNFICSYFNNDNVDYSYRIVLKKGAIKRILGIELETDTYIEI